MSIRVIQEADVIVSADELARYQYEYEQSFMFHAGPNPALEEFIRRKRSKPLGDLWRSQGKKEGEK